MPTRIKLITALLALYIAGALIPIGGDHAMPARRAPAANEAATRPPAPIAPIAPIAPRPTRPTRPRAPAFAEPQPARAPQAEPVEPLAHGSPSFAQPATIETEAPSGGPPPPDEFAALELQWQRESDDVRGSEAQRAKLMTLFDELQLPGELIRDVRCRRSVCRFAIEASDMLRLAGLAGRVQASDPPVSFRVQDGQAFAYVPRG